MLALPPLAQVGLLAQTCPFSTEPNRWLGAAEFCGGGTIPAMATQDDVREIASKLPGAIEGQDRFGFSILVKGKAKGFVWSWAERVDPKKAKVINDGVLVVLVPTLLAKDLILESNPAIYFTEAHYNGYPAVLVRLEAISTEELRPLIEEAWRCKAPKDLADLVPGSE